VAPVDGRRTCDPEHVLSRALAPLTRGDRRGLDRSTSPAGRGIPSQDEIDGGDDLADGGPHEGHVWTAEKYRVLSGRTRNRPGSEKSAGSSIPSEVRPRPADT
jgi:hypothetical protein